MNWFINDLSVDAQYATPTDFIDHIRHLLELRYKTPEFAKSLLCTRTIMVRPVTQNLTFQEAIYSTKDHNLRSLTLNWISKSGPFWEEQRQVIEDDYFEYDNRDITDSGIGEAARHSSTGSISEVVSFQGSGFDQSPLLVIQGLPEEPLDSHTLKNNWTWDQLRHSIQAARPPIRNWAQMGEEASARFEYLNLSSACVSPLQAEPFSSYAAQRVMELLGVLNEYIENLAPNGALTDRNNELMRMHFSGPKAWFTDESESNKSKFRKELTFPNDSEDGNKLFCPMHGKIKTPQYRIHFEWPPKGRTPLRVVYIGPKLTKG